MSDRPEPGLGFWPETALTAVTLAAAVSLGRLFADGSFLGPVVVAGIGSHVVAALARRAGFGLAAAATLSAAGLALCVTWVLLPETAAYLFPTGATWDALRGDLSAAWGQFGEVVAPAEPEDGFVQAAVLAVWASAFVADWAAFRLSAPFEAIVPGFTTFAFTAALGTSGGRLPTTALFLAAVLAFLLVHNATRRAETSAWFASKVRGGPQAILRSGLGIGAATLAAALVLGPAIPGARDAALLDWRNDGDGGGSRVTVSPLVDIRGRLVDQPSTEVFTVRTQVRSYWRLTSLDGFDGEVWGSKGSYRRARGTLGRDVPIGGTLAESVQEFTIAALDTIWLPAAYRPERIEGADASFDPDSGSLLTDADTAAGALYRVQSVLPRLTGPQLAAAPVEVPPDVLARYTALPSGFPPAVAELAGRVVAGRATVYEMALALQNWFRQNFTYSTDVQPGHGENAIVRFLNQRRGYCEQFAGTYAAMARALGIPARVAVGFTPGELRDDGLYHVTGRQAHAWPEVYVAGFGWVAFEPTPGRGAPGAQSYTGVPEQQDTTTGVEVTPTTAPAAPPSTVAPPPPDQGQEPGRDDELLAGATGASTERTSPWVGRLRGLAIVVVLVGGTWLVGVPAATAVRRRRRRARATSVPDRVLVAWAEASEALALSGVARRPSETHAEYAERATHAAGLTPLLLGGLANDAATACFAPPTDEGADAGHAAELAERAERAAAAVAAEVRDGVGWRRRLRWALDPRPLLPSDPRRAGVHAVRDGGPDEPERERETAGVR